MQNQLLNDLAGRVSIPCYIFDSDAFASRVSAVNKAFGPDTRLCFSMKANPFLLRCLPECFDAVEVCSPGELNICRQLGVDMEKIIFSGVNKSPKDVEQAMEDGVGVFTAESLLHFDLISAEAARRGRIVPVLLRLTAGSQFGMDEGDILKLLANRQAHPWVSIVGLHYFSGTQKRKSATIEKELDKVLAFIERVQYEHGFRFERLEYVTGLAVDYFSDEADHLEQDRLEAVSFKIRQIAKKVSLTVEMGRFFAAPCGVYLTRVVDTKCNQGINYAIVDGGMHQIHYDGQFQGMQIPQIDLLKPPTGQKERWTLCGSLCTTADVLTRDVLLDGVALGDVLAFHRTGAYSVMEGMSVFLSRDMPSVYLYSLADGLRQVRKPIQTDPINTPQNP